jgi:Tetracyclin repressor-like, C-terminal domain
VSRVAGPARQLPRRAFRRRRIPGPVRGGGPGRPRSPSLLAAADRDPGLADLHRAATRHRVDGLTGILDRGVETGDLPVDTDAGAAATLLAATLCYRRLITGEPVSGGTAATPVDRVLDNPPRHPRH